ncbi:hypothetical protein GTA08_BOTSDO10894 [Botryosphaeria dothidea]|uniref:Uncharacterized protein n=1 Tax=Botryosphaeria dothidea TaxID=55169 RepID=A0A8H4IIU8_9PEZI|nr:hypothetical protein GTA08_BOTSDO10894 [Botryosphaeria dothidea]
MTESGPSSQGHLLPRVWENCLLRKITEVIELIFHHIYTALFGNGSVIDAFTSSNYLDYLNSTGGYRTWHDDYGYVCQAIVPLGRMVEFSGSGNDDYGANTCIVPTESGNLQQIQTYVAGWLHNFFDELGMAAALRMAAFMANDILLNNPGRSDGLYVSVDEGRDMLAPVMPIEGVIAGSVLLGTFRVSLLGLVVFALRMPRWTDRLDATATLQMGAAMALSTEGLAKMRCMNGVRANTPGFVGDVLPDGDIGRIAVGAENSLRRNKTYEAELCAVMPQ